VPEAMINFLALLGWHPSGDKEVFTREELIAGFDIDRVQQSGAIFNEEKLDWLNREHIKAMPIAEVATLAAPFFAKKNIAIKDEELLKRVVAVQVARAKTLEDIAEASTFFFDVPEYEPNLLIWKDSSTLKEVFDILSGVRVVIAGVAAEDFIKETLTACLPLIVGDKSRGLVLWPLRVALSGQANSPDPIEIMSVLGRDESLKRIDAAIKKASS
jgi:glutamyl/glutaminyl-tRNA synthetase